MPSEFFYSSMCIAITIPAYDKQVTNKKTWLQHLTINSNNTAIKCELKHELARIWLGLAIGSRTDTNSIQTTHHINLLQYVKPEEEHNNSTPNIGMLY